MGNFWGAVMSIPEARKAKLCMVAHDKCKANEILKQELSSNKEDQGQAPSDSSSRLLVNPEFVQNLDQSDGSEQFN